jgi:predicted membrane protein
VERNEKKRKLTGALILIVLGVLIILNTMELYEFSKSWPLLLIVIAVSTLLQKGRDLGGWFIGIVGAVFFVIGNFGDQVERVTAYIVPVLLIALGIYLLGDHLKDRRKGSGK